MNVVKKILGPKNYNVKKVGTKYMIFDTDIGEFLFGYSFDTSEEADAFIK